MRDPLQTVAPAKPFDVQFAHAAIDLEREQVLPLSAAHVQPGGLARGGTQHQERVVVDRHPPEVRMGKPIDLREISEKPPRQVDEVHPLIDQLATTRSLRVRPPFALVADTAPMAVATTQEHRLAEGA